MDNFNAFVIIHDKNHLYINHLIDI